MAPSEMPPQAQDHLIEENDSDGFDAEQASAGFPRQGHSASLRGSRARLAVAAVSGVLLLAGTAAKLAWQPRASASAIQDNVVSLAEKQIILFPRPLECSVAGTQDCSSSKCCQDFGFQCFAKNATWSTCLKKCDSSKMKKHGNGTWSCDKLGHKNRCAATASENCNIFGCCADVGHQCYAKNKDWGACLKTCNPQQMKAFDKLKEDWSCDPIGPRNTVDYRNDYIKSSSPDPVDGMVEVEPWVKNCSHIGQNCASTKCCSWTGYKCYEKNATWASCLRQCFPDKWNGGFPELPMVQKGSPKANPPAHWNVTFSMAPPGPWTCKRLSVPMKPGKLVGTSLYCFTVVVMEDGTGKPVYAMDILKKAQEKYTNIFACDRWTVFSDKEAELNPGKTVKVLNPHIAKRPNTEKWVNTPMFLTVWKIIRQATTWKSFPWVVKVDPVSVFIPYRLRAILKYQHVTDNGVFLENCKYVRMSFHGSMEVMSNKAFGTLLDHLEDCQRVLPWSNGSHAHFRYYGEDKFAAWCMLANGVDKVPSLQQVETVPEDQPITGLHLTVSCPGHRSLFEMQKKKWHPNCSRVKTAGMHAFKTVEKYFKCLEETTM